MEMSEVEQVSLLREWKAFKRWLPVVSGAFIAAMFLIKGTHYFDSNIATKDDISTLTKELTELQKDVSIIKTNTQIKNISDTTYKLTINNRLTVVEEKVQHILDHRLAGLIAHKNCPTCKTTFAPLQ